MIINVQGTSGSGKTTIAEAVRDAYRYRQAIMGLGRRNPIAYFLSHDVKLPAIKADTMLIGHYESHAGGADSFSDPSVIPGIIRDYYIHTTNIFVEGCRISGPWSTSWIQHEVRVGCEVKVIVLTTEAAACIQAANERRARIGNATPADANFIIGKKGLIERNIPALRSTGAEVLELNREEARRMIFGWLELPL